jgi:hypothetical protein
MTIYYCLLIGSPNGLIQHLKVLTRSEILEEIKDPYTMGLIVSIMHSVRDFNESYRNSYADRTSHHDMCRILEILGPYIKANPDLDDCADAHNETVCVLIIACIMLIVSIEAKIDTFGTRYSGYEYPRYSNVFKVLNALRPYMTQ